jgi:hypothetical protein
MPADIGKAVRRFLSAIAFLVALVVVLGAAGCGNRFERSGEPPAPNDLAADALAALENAGSAHFVLDYRSTFDDAGGKLNLHAEGDASETAVVADGTLDFGFMPLTGHLEIGEHDFFIRFMDEWYGEHSGLADAAAAARRPENRGAWDELATPQGLRENFDELFDGDVTEGATEDGTATWRFEGTLDADGALDLARRLHSAPPAQDEDLFRKLAAATHVVLEVGQEDKLPRRLEFSVQLSPDDLDRVQESDARAFEAAENFRSSLELSDFGKSVELHAPSDAKPLDALFEKLFGGFE